MASAVSASGATVSGTVNASGQSSATYYFEYGTTTSYGTQSPPQPVSGNTNQTVTATLSGLSANTTYHYEVVVKTSSGQLIKGGDQTFTTTSGAAGATGTGTTGRTTTATTTRGPTTGPYTTVRPTTSSTGPYTTVQPTTSSTGPYTTVQPTTGSTSPPSTSQPTTGR